MVMGGGTEWGVAMLDGVRVSWAGVCEHGMLVPGVDDTDPVSESLVPIKIDRRHCSHN